jgi:hypothetical protein
MAQFNPEDYETVASRIQRFYEEHPDGRIVTENVTTENDRAQSIWIVKSYVYLNTGDQAAGLPKATGYAFEVDGVGMANKTSALENCETSSIGRCLANMGMSGDLRGNSQTRVTREEMEKVQRGVTPGKLVAKVDVPEGFLDAVKAAATLEELQPLWETATANGFSADVRAAFTARKNQLGE